MSCTNGACSHLQSISLTFVTCVFDHTLRANSGRWRHFLANGKDRIQPLIDEWRQTTAPIEIARRLIDLFVVSVLLDAGAGPHWKYCEEGDKSGVSRVCSAFISSVVLLTDVAAHLHRLEGVKVSLWRPSKW